jgi:hypothetical protein
LDQEPQADSSHARGVLRPEEPGRIGGQARAEELGERIFNILDGEKSYFVQLNAIAACLAVMLYGDDDAELLLRMFGDKVLRDLRVMAEIERERSR